MAVFWGWANEVFPGGGSSGPNSEASYNMDFWNNKVARKYGSIRNRFNFLDLLFQNVTITYFL